MTSDADASRHLLQVEGRGEDQPGFVLVPQQRSSPQNRGIDSTPMPFERSWVSCAACSRACFRLSRMSFVQRDLELALRCRRRRDSDPPRGPPSGLAADWWSCRGTSESHQIPVPYCTRYRSSSRPDKTIRMREFSFRRPVGATTRNVSSSTLRHALRSHIVLRIGIRKGETGAMTWLPVV